MGGTANIKLEQGETILWNGKPEEFTVLDATHKKYFIIKLVLSIIIFTVMITGHVLLSLKYGFALQLPIIIMLAVLAAILTFLSTSLFIKAKKVKKTVSYIITNKRLIVKQAAEKSVLLSAIKEVRFYTDEAGHTSLLCGNKGIKIKGNKIRTSTLANVNGHHDCESFAMYALPIEAIAIVRPLLHAA